MAEGVGRIHQALSAAVLLGTVALTACSPEATRSRSGGPGADFGNRTSDVEIHGQTNPYYRTPGKNPGTNAPTASR